MKSLLILLPLIAYLFGCDSNLAVNTIGSVCPASDPNCLAGKNAFNFVILNEESYSNEQTAEWMELLGLGALYAVDAQLVLAEKYFAKGPASPDWIASSDCRKYADKGWINEKGEPVMVPVGLWGYNHGFRT